MVDILYDVPSHVSAFSLTGKVTEDDYKDVIMPAIDRMLKTSEKIHFLLVIKTEMSNFTTGAIAQDIWLGLKNITKWHRMAIVTDQLSVRKFTDVASYPLPGEAKGFSLAQLDEAKRWVAQ